MYTPPVKLVHVQPAGQPATGPGVGLGAAGLSNEKLVIGMLVATAQACPANSAIPAESSVLTRSLYEFREAIM